MKKYRFLSALMAVVLLLLSMTACQTAPTDDDKLLASTPSSSGAVTPPSSSAVPPMSSVPATSSVPPSIQSTLPPACPSDEISGGYAHNSGSSLDDMRFVWYVNDTKERITICDEWACVYASNDTHVFFVKNTEPTRVYVTAIGDFENHYLYYESPYGNINFMIIAHGAKDCLLFVVDSKRFYLLEISTRESFFLMEQYHIESVYMVGLTDAFIGFDGRPTADDREGTWSYNRETGECIRNSGDDEP